MPTPRPPTMLSVGKRRGFETTCAPAAGSLAAAGRAASLTVETGGDAMEFVVTDLIDGWDVLSYHTTSGAGTATWMTDETGGFVRLFWSAGGNRGLRWGGGQSGPRQQQVYVKFDLRRLHSNANSKQLKIMGRGNLANPQYATSNFTFGPQRSGYGGGTGAGGVSYSDRTSGGDNVTSPPYSGYTSPPSTGGGGSFSRTPYPTQTVTTSGVTQAINDWDTWEMFVRYNDDGVNNGIIAVRKNGVLIFQYDDCWNCGTGLQEIGTINFGEYINSAQVPPGGFSEDYRRIYISWDAPSWLV